MSTSALPSRRPPHSMPWHRRSRRALAPMLRRLLFRAGTYDALRRLQPSRHLAILRYHAICDPATATYAAPGICVSAPDFERQVAYLTTHYTVLDLPDAVARMRAGKDLPRNSVVFTFDDGYADNLEAARILHKHGVSGTFYLTAGCLADGEPFWPAEIRGLLGAMSSPVAVVEVNGSRLELPRTTAAEREATARRLSQIFKSNPIPVREALRAELRRQAGHPALTSPMLTWAQARQMRALGMTLGAHTLTHPNLPNAGLEAATREIEGSKARIEREIGVPVTEFSYPNGGAETYFTRPLQEVVRTAGFLAAATSRNGFATLASDLYALERVQVATRLDELAFRLEVERFAFKPRAEQAY